MAAQTTAPIGEEKRRVGDEFSGVMLVAAHSAVVLDPTLRHDTSKFDQRGEDLALAPCHVPVVPSLCLPSVPFANCSRLVAAVFSTSHESFSAPELALDSRIVAALASTQLECPCW